MKTETEYEIRKVGGKFEVYHCGKFVMATDDIMEAAQEIERRKDEDYGN